MLSVDLWALIDPVVTLGTLPNKTVRKPEYFSELSTEESEDLLARQRHGCDSTIVSWASEAELLHSEALSQNNVWRLNT